MLPAAECLKDVVARVLPYWYDAIAPQLMAGLDVLITAHGNSLRSICKVLDRLDNTEILAYEIGTGVPMIYTLNADTTVASKEVLA